MKIINGYHGYTKEDIMNMSEQNLREAVIRMFSVDTIEFGKDAGWMGDFLLPDELVDAFRGRV